MPVDYQEKHERHQRLRGVSKIEIGPRRGLTNDHGRLSEPVLGISNLASGTTKLGIDLHGNVGAVLRLSLLDMSNVDA